MVQGLRFSRSVSSVQRCLLWKFQAQKRAATDACGVARYGEAKLQVMSEYHFCVALENSAHADYVTEKALQALAAGIIDHTHSVLLLLFFLLFFLVLARKIVHMCQQRLKASQLVFHLCSSLSGVV